MRVLNQVTLFSIVSLIASASFAYQCRTPDRNVFYSQYKVLRSYRLVDYYSKIITSTSSESYKQRLQTRLDSIQANQSIVEQNFLDSVAAANNCNGIELPVISRISLNHLISEEREGPSSTTYVLSWSTQGGNDHDGFIVEEKTGCHPITDVCTYRELARVGKYVKQHFIRVGEFGRGLNSNVRVRAFKKTNITDLHALGEASAMPTRPTIDQRRVVDLTFQEGGGGVGRGGDGPNDDRDRGDVGGPIAGGDGPGDRGEGGDAGAGSEGSRGFGDFGGR